MTKSETKYPVNKLEFLCLKWAIIDQFHEYLYGNTFDVYTDNNPLTYALTTAKLDEMGHRWITSLANYNFHTHYKSGQSNVEADALSRIDWEKCNESIQANSIQAIVAAAITGQVTNHNEAVPCSPQVINELLPSISDTTAISKVITWSSRQSHPTCLEAASFALQMDDSSHLRKDQDPSMNPRCMTILDWVEAQSKDKTIGKVIHLYKSKELQCQKGKETDNQDMKQFIRQWIRLLMRHGILYLKNEIQEVNCPGRNTMQLVLPKAFRKQALQGCHDDLGHLGTEWTIDLLRDWFYSPRMMEDTVRHIKQCETCLRFKTVPDKATMESVDAMYPMELVHMDYLTVEANKGGKDIHILVITDHFTQYT